jgi:cytochrome c553
MKPVLPLAALFVLSAALPALAVEEKAAANADPAKATQIATTVCAGCHGPDGNSAVPVNPNLAGQVPQYITKQLMNFKDADKPGGRKNAIMQGMVATLSPEDMISLGAYFAQQAPKPGTAKDKTLALLGEKLYRGGDASRGIPACAGCHSPAGSGIPAQYPRVASQQTEYVVAQLKAFRSGERENDPNKMMQMIAVKMRDQDMLAVAEYMQGLR